MFSERLLLLQGQFQHPLYFLPQVGGCPSLLGKVTFPLVGSARNNTNKRWGGGWARMIESSPSMHRDLGLSPSTSLYLGVMVRVCPTLRSWELYDQKSKVIPGYIVWGLLLLHLYLFQCPIFAW